MKRRDQIGFSQRTHFDWLEYTANLVLAGNTRDEIVTALSDRLKEKLSVGNEPLRGNRDKAITILTRIWVSVPRDLQSLREEGLAHLRSRGESDRMLVHWCMCMAVTLFSAPLQMQSGGCFDCRGAQARPRCSADSANVLENAKP